MSPNEIVNDIWQQALRQHLRPGQTVSFTVSIKTDRRERMGKPGIAPNKRLDAQIARLFRGRWGIRKIDTRGRADQRSFTFVVSEPFAERRMLAADEREKAEERRVVDRHGQLALA